MAPKIHLFLDSSDWIINNFFLFLSYLSLPDNGMSYWCLVFCYCCFFFFFNLITAQEGENHVVESFRKIPQVNKLIHLFPETNVNTCNKQGKWAWETQMSQQHLPATPCGTKNTSQASVVLLPPLKAAALCPFVSDKM